MEWHSLKVGALHAVAAIQTLKTSLPLVGVAAVALPLRVKIQIIAVAAQWETLPIQSAVKTG